MASKLLPSSLALGLIVAGLSIHSPLRAEDMLPPPPPGDDMMAPPPPGGFGLPDPNAIAGNVVGNATGQANAALGNATGQANAAMGDALGSIPGADMMAPPPPGGDMMAPPMGDMMAPPMGDAMAPPPPGGDMMAPPGGDMMAPPPGGDMMAPPPGGDMMAPPPGGDSLAPPPADNLFPEPQAEAPAESSNGGKVTSYEVSKNDSLWKIAGKKKIYADPFQWPILFIANREKIKDPDMIKPGWDLKVKRNASSDEVANAVQKAKDTPRYEPHTAPRKKLPIDY